MSGLPQQVGAMQAATLRCPPSVFRERYSMSDFEVTHVYGEGPNWSVCAARCKWSSEPVVLQTYTEAGNVSGCMALALAAAHSLTRHPALLPLYAVFRDYAGGDGGAGGGGGAGAARADRVVMVYPGGPAQHPLDTGSLLPGANPLAGSGSGPPVSERGVVRGLLQPLGELVAVLAASGLRPPYVCGLDVWMDSPEAPAPGQALFMVPLLCHRRPHGLAGEVPLCALPYASPYLRANPAAAGDPEPEDKVMSRRWLSWSAAALVHTVLIGSPPPEKAARRQNHKGRSHRASLPAAASAPVAPSVLQLPLLSPGGGSSPRKSMNMLMTLGIQRPGSLMPPPGHGWGTDSNGNGTNGATLMHRRSSGSGNGIGIGAGGGGGGGGVSGVQDPMPLWLSDEAGDWFRRGLMLQCSSRPPLDELMRHPWVTRHAVPRAVSVGHILKRESLSYLPRELHPLMLDVVPLGVTRPAREEVESLMAEMAASEGPSAAKPAMPWQVVEGPQEPGPEYVDEFSAPDAEDEAADATRDGSDTVLERYEVAEEQRDDGTRVVEELRVVSGKADGSFARAAKALQAAMARRGGDWVMAAPRGATFDDIAKQQTQQRVLPPAPAGGARRGSTAGAPSPSPTASPAPGSQPAAAAPAASRSPAVGRGKSPARNKAFSSSAPKQKEAAAAAKAAAK